jgi:c-di-GMP-binding flagellar brake protein YcgR
VINTANDKGSDRRQYFRIQNSLFMSYELISENDDKIQAKEVSSRSLRSIHLLKELNSILEENEAFSQTLTETERTTKYYLEALSDKVTDITRYLVKTLGVEYNELLEVDLSGGGVRFESDTPLSVNQVLRLDLVLVPEYYNLNTIGTVVDCKPVGASGNYHIAISFSDIQENDRDAIVRHVFKKQSEQLRQDNQTQ